MKIATTLKLVNSGKSTPALVRFEFDKASALIIAQPNLTVSNSALQFHVAMGHLPQDLHSGYRQVDDRQIVEALEFALMLCLPKIGVAAAVAVDDDVTGSPTSFTHFFRLAGSHLSRAQWRRPSLLAKPRGFALDAESLAEAQCFLRISAKPSTRTIIRSSVSEGWRAVVSA